MPLVGEPLERVAMVRRQLDRRQLGREVVVVMKATPMDKLRKSIAATACLLAGAPLAASGAAGSATHAAAPVFHLSSINDKASATKVDASSLAEVSGARKQWKAGITGAG